MKRLELKRSLRMVAVAVSLAASMAHADQTPVQRATPQIDLAKTQSVSLFNKLGQKVRVTCGAAKASASGEIGRLLALSDVALYEEARAEIGRCKIALGGVDNYCKYYVLRDGRGYPQGTGCTTDYYAPDGNAKRGEFFNAISFLREMIEAGLCTR